MANDSIRISELEQLTTLKDNDVILAVDSTESDPDKDTKQSKVQNIKNYINAYTKSETDNLLNSKANTSDIPDTSNFITQNEIDTHNADPTAHDDIRTEIDNLAVKVDDIDIPDAYALPTASETTLGGVMIGSGISIDSNGVISVINESGSVDLSEIESRLDDLEEFDAEKIGDTDTLDTISKQVVGSINELKTAIFEIEDSSLLSNEDREKLDIIASDGDGTKYLSDDGTYKTIEQSEEGRDFTTNPIDLESEITGVLPIGNVDISSLQDQIDTVTDGVSEHETRITALESENHFNWRGEFQLGNTYNTYDVVRAEDGNDYIATADGLVLSPPSSGWDLFLEGGNGSETPILPEDIATLDDIDDKISEHNLDENSHQDIRDLIADIEIGEGRDFTETPIDLESEVTGVLPIQNVDTSSLFSGDYEDLTNKPDIPEIPENVSEFVNDAGYITSVPYDDEDVGVDVSLIRDFLENPIDLGTEVIGVLSVDNIDVSALTDLILVPILHQSTGQDTLGGMSQKAVTDAIEERMPKSGGVFTDRIFVPQAGIGVYVSPSGNDNNPGTSALPFKTIARAADYVSTSVGNRNITIFVRPGTYNESALNINFMGTQLSIQGESGNAADVTINLTSSLTLTCLQTYLRYLTIVPNPTYDTYTSVGLVSAYASVQDCIFNGSMQAKQRGITITGGGGFVYMCAFNNFVQAICSLNGCTLQALNNTGSGNRDVLYAQGGILLASGSVPAGAVPVAKSQGGMVSVNSVWAP